jgi:hypothetical protein
MRHVFKITTILDEVGPPGPDFWIFELAVFEFEAEVCVDSKEKCIQPPAQVINLW